MGNIGYIRIGDKTYINVFTELYRDRLIEICDGLGFDFSYKREDYYFDWVTDIQQYSWAFDITCTMEDTMEIIRLLNEPIEEQTPYAE